MKKEDLIWIIIVGVAILSIIFSYSDKIIEIIKKIFKKLFSLFIILIIIAFILGGVYIGNEYNNLFMGIIAGFIIGAVFAIYIGGKTAISMSIEKKLEEILIKLSPENKYYLENNSYNSESTKEVVSINEDINKEDNLEINDLGEYRINGFIELFEEPISTSFVVFKPQFNEIVTLKKIGDKISDNNYWYYIKNKKGIYGWCFSENLEKI